MKGGRRRPLNHAIMPIEAARHCRRALVTRPGEPAVWTESEVVSLAGPAAISDRASTFRGCNESEGGTHMNGSGLNDQRPPRPLPAAVVARAWRDPIFMASLSEDDLAALPESPAGRFAGLRDDDRQSERQAGTIAATCSTIAATCSTIDPKCSTIAASCSSVAASCSTVAASCSTIASGCSTVSADCSTVAATCSTVAAKCSTIAASCSTIAADCRPRGGRR